ncbi:sentrin-specific protease 6-like [Eurytemora carolleeae]|uniref:sentrin-specific protease 6-like n=1 Tax=Eurytemora carolleeae TaxID=1294199 RepID=UPI000C7740B6|nr:sentrin-specific protease 6-like [Eurytemora carolleeae]|eukprot:XP_023320677.1 sentrin-specific protease 6-like [Eurytemora affinis]
MVIFPICQESHWFLIIAVKPGLIQKPDDPEERLTRGDPFLILLDSMGGYKEKAVSIIRQCLSCEWKAKRGGTETFSAREIKLMKPNKPEQDNFTDCGVFLLHYVEKIFCSVVQFDWSKLPDLTNWFPMEEILKKRFELATHIQNLARSQKGVTQFPVIKLNNGDPSRRSKRRKGFRAELDYGTDLEEALDLPGAGEFSVGHTPVRESTSAESTPVRESTSAESTPVRKSTSAESTPVRESTSAESTPVRESTSAEPQSSNKLDDELALVGDLENDELG